MRIYIAARYDRRWEMLGVAADLLRAGHDVTSRWIEGRGDGPEVAAREDVADVLRAECLVSFTEEPAASVPWSARGGRHVEFGVALVSGKRLCLDGPQENIFHYLPQVEVYATRADLLDALAGGPRRS